LNEKTRKLRLLAQAKGHKVTLRSLAKHVGVAAPTIHKIEQGRIKLPSQNIVEKIAAYYSEILDQKITADYLYGDFEEVKIDPQSLNLGRVNPIIACGNEHLSIPVLSEIPQGNLDQVSEEHVLTREFLPISLFREAKFAIQASDNSMAPIIEKDDTVFIRPSAEFLNGQCVLASLEGRMLCRYLQHQEGGVILFPSRPGFSTVMLPASEGSAILGQAVKVLKSL
jgi:SOS-response transcriptional repressor LexA